MAIVLEHDRDQDRIDKIGHDAERWMAVHANAFSAMPLGTTVVIDIASGDYVASAGWHDAQELFDRRFGEGAPSYTFTVGEPTFVGGGCWRA